MKTDLIFFLFLFKIWSIPGKFDGVRWFGFVSVCNLTAVLCFGSCIGAHGSVCLRITTG